MELGFAYYGEMIHPFDATSADGLRAGCLQGWNLLEAKIAPDAMKPGVLPQLMIKNVFSKHENRWVPGRFRFPPTGSGLMAAPHPFRDKDADWTELWEAINRSRSDLASAATFLDSMDKG